MQIGVLHLLDIELPRNARGNPTPLLPGECIQRWRTHLKEKRAWEGADVFATNFTWSCPEFCRWHLFEHAWQRWIHDRSTCAIAHNIAFAREHLKRRNNGSAR